MKTKFKLIQALSIMSAGLLFSTGAFANELVNGDFELNPPTSGFGNHIGHPITPWVIGAGSPTNIIRTDQGISSTGQGPRKDASGTALGTIRHYLDITNGGNELYQTFKAKCTGKAVFGGYFSTRQNRNATGSVTLRNGIGVTGSIIGQVNSVVLPGGNSTTDPWKFVNYSSPVVAGNVYSLVITMDNNINFDEAFVGIKCNDVTDPSNPGPFDPEPPPIKPSDNVISTPVYPRFKSEPLSKSAPMKAVPMERR